MQVGAGAFSLQTLFSELELEFLGFTFFVGAGAFKIQQFFLELELKFLSCNLLRRSQSQGLGCLALNVGANTRAKGFNSKSS